MRPSSFDPSLYLVTDPGAPGGVLETVREAVAGGVTVVQLRDKTASDEAIAELGRALLALLRPLGVPLLINDRVGVALAIGADGVHVGQSDESASHARTRLGPGAIVGLSVTSLDDARRLDDEIVDYAGVGPVFMTQTKSDLSPPVGLDGLREIVQILTVPSVAIGGLGPENGGEVMRAGVQGLCVVSAICSSPDPRGAARRLFETVRGPSAENS